MEQLLNITNEELPRETTAMARVFAAHVGKKSLSHQETMMRLTENLILARESGNSFITLEAEESAALLANPHFCRGEKALFHLEGSHLYLYREFHNEAALAEAIASKLQAPAPENAFSDAEIRAAFVKSGGPGFEPHENQTDAVKNCLSSNFSIITGGPGTGKTTIIAALVTLEVKRNPGIVIEIAAPTGKAAELLTAGLAKACPEYPLKAETLHKLFKAQHGSGRFNCNGSNPLDCDLLIVDECSMISLDTAAKMFNGLKPGTRVVLSGDHRQLEAIGPGAVLDSLLTFDPGEREAARKLKKASTELTANYRSKLAPTIQELAKALREEDDVKLLTQRITNAASDHYCFKKSGKETHKEALESALSHWKKLPEVCAEITAGSRKQAFEMLKSFRIITASRVGQDGCIKFNEEIMKALDLDSPESPGSALLISQNCRRTALSNGDTGIVFTDSINGGVKVCFEHLEEPLSFHDLPPFESAFAMTVHKAQGSGFSEVFFPLPTKDTPLLTKELFYTALTRAAMKITISGTLEMVEAALMKKSCRSTALRKRILSQLEKADDEKKNL